MRPRPPTNPQALMAYRISELRSRFEYPDIDTVAGAGIGGGGGGMAHVLIVSTSEPADVQAKADYVIPQTNSAGPLNQLFTQLDAAMMDQGSWSIWMAGIFDLDDDVVAPSRAWIRGLGFTLEGGSS